jgi:hypothetical protein
MEEAGALWADDKPAVKSRVPPKTPAKTPKNCAKDEAAGGDDVDGADPVTPTPKTKTPNMLVSMRAPLSKKRGRQAKDSDVDGEDAIGGDVKRQKARVTPGANMEEQDESKEGIKKEAEGSDATVGE